MGEVRFASRANILLDHICSWEKLIDFQTYEFFHRSERENFNFELSWPILKNPVERTDMTAPDSQLCHRWSQLAGQPREPRCSRNLNSLCGATNSWNLALRSVNVCQNRNERYRKNQHFLAKLFPPGSRWVLVMQPSLFTWCFLNRHPFISHLLRYLPFYLKQNTCGYCCWWFQMLLGSIIKIPSGSCSVRQLTQHGNLVSVLQAERHSMLEPGEKLGTDKKSV